MPPKYPCKIVGGDLGWTASDAVASYTAHFGNRIRFKGFVLVYELMEIGTGSQ